MKHLVRVLRELNELQTSEETIRVLERYEKEVEQDRVPIQTMSSAVNTILNLKREEAIQRGIDITVNANITHEIDMEDSDLYLLLSNLMDNAIEHIGIEKKIRVEIRDVEEMMMIRVANSADIDLLNSNHEFYSSATEENHGFGVRTIRQIAEKYGGFLTYVQEDHMITATVLIPVMNPKNKDA